MMEEQKNKTIVKLNIGLSVSQNFNVVKLELIDHALEIEEGEESFDRAVTQIYNGLMVQVRAQHEAIARVFPRRGAK